MTKTTTRRTKLGILVIGVLFAGAPPVLQRASAQDFPADARQRMETAAARQTAAVKTMERSIARQSDSVKRHFKSAPATDFFNEPGNAPGPPVLSVQSTLRPSCDVLPPTEIDSLVNAASGREGVEPALIRSVMRQESAFRPCAVSPKGALGLMQLMPQTAANLEVTDPFDPEDNVAAGTKLLRQLLQRYGGNLALTLGAYNAGPRRVDAEMAVPAIPETTNYVQRVLSFLPMEQMRDLSFDSGLGN